MNTKSSAIWAFAIIVVLIVAGVLAYTMRSRKADPPPVIANPIVYLPANELGYKILTGQSVDLTNVPKNDEFFVQTWLVRDKIPEWNDWFAAAHQQRIRQRQSAAGRVARDAPSTLPWPPSPGTAGVLDAAFALIANAMFDSASGKASVPLIIERLPTVLSPLNAVVGVYDDESTTIPRMDITKLMPGMAALVVIFPDDPLAASQLELAGKTALHPFNEQEAANQTSIGGIVTPSDISSYMAGSIFATDMTTGYRLLRYALTDLEYTDQVGPGASSSINLEYTYTIPFGAGGLEIYSYSFGDPATRVVISNLHKDGAIKCYWESVEPILVATPAMVASSLGVSGSDALVTDDDGISLTPTGDLASRAFNLFDRTMAQSSNTVMQIAASGKYDPDSHIHTAVYAGIGFIVNVDTGAFAAQMNLAGDPILVFDFTLAPVDITIASVSPGTLDSTGKIVTLEPGYTTVRGYLTTNSAAALRNQLAADLEATGNR